MKPFVTNVEKLEIMLREPSPLLMREDGIIDAQLGRSALCDDKDYLDGYNMVQSFKKTGVESASEVVDCDRDSADST
jgi:hypothetical protein